MKLYVISDTHFGHENIYKFTTETGVRVRPEFTTAAEADAEMVRRWNAIVNPDDHVWHLGDVCMHTKYLSIVRHLLGHKRLILGNHDKGKVTEYLAAGFQKIASYRLYEGFLMSHIPIHPDSLTKGRINVHGHIHERAPYGPQYRNVSVERIGYAPVWIESLR